MSGTTLDLSDLDPARSRLLDEIGYEMREPYHDLVRELARDRRYEPDWWVTHLATRNTDASPLFESLCKLQLVRELHREEGALGRVVTRSVPLRKTLLRYARQHGLELEVELRRGREDDPGLLRRLIRRPWIRALKWPRLVARFLFLWLWAKLTRLLHDGGADRLRGPITVLDAFLGEGSFREGEFRDRFFPGLEEHLSPEERTRLFRLPLYIDLWGEAPGVFAAIRRSERRFLLPEDFLRLDDYLEAFWYPVRALRLVDDPPSFRGFDTGPLVRHDLWFSAFAQGSWHALLRYRAIGRMADRGISVRTAVNWYENQVGDKGFNGGFQHHHPDTEVVGYQPNFYHHFFFCMRPLTEELEGGFGPDTVAVGGKARLDEPRRYAPDLPTEVSPALRNAGLWRPRRFEPDEEHLTVLAGLPIRAEDSVRILEHLRGATSTLEVDGLRLWIKLHPACPREELREALEAPWPVETEEVGGSFDDVVQRADLFVGSAGGTPVEAMCRGVPSLLVANPRGLTRVGIPDGAPDELSTLCYGPDELGRALRAAVSRVRDDRAQLRRLGEKLREDHYEPVTRAGVRRLLRLDEGGDAAAEDVDVSAGEKRR